MSENASRLTFQATVEDCSDEEHRPQGAKGANISSKRSSEMRQSGKDKPADILSDVATDSGYSSRTAATMSSADYAESSHSASRSKNSPPAPVPTRPAPAESPRKKSSQPSRQRPEKEKDKERAKAEKVKSDKSKPEKPKRAPPVVNQSELPPRSKPSAQSSKTRTQTEREHRSHDRYENDHRSNRPKPPTIDTDGDYRRRSSQYELPQSPGLTRTTSNARVPQSPSIILPGQTPRARRSSSAAGQRPRPYSIHSADSTYYSHHAPMPSVDIPYGPPPSNSAYANYVSPPGTTAYVQHTPPNTNYFTGQHSAMAQTPSINYSGYAVQQQTNGSEPRYSTRERPSSMYNTVVSQPTVSQQYPTSARRDSSAAQGPSARYASKPLVGSYTSTHRALLPAADSETSESEYEEDETGAFYGTRTHGTQRYDSRAHEGYQYDSRQYGQYPSAAHSMTAEQYAAYAQAEQHKRQMPPPKMIPSRPAMTHRPDTYAYGTSPVQERQSRREKEYHFPGDYVPHHAATSSRSSRRPSLSSSSRTKETSYTNSTGSSRQRAIIEKQNRRLSYAGPVKPRPTSTYAHEDYYYDDNDENDDDVDREEYEEYIDQDPRPLRRKMRTRTRTESDVRPAGGMQSKLKEAANHQRAEEGDLVTASDTLLRAKAKTGPPLGYLEAKRSSDTKSQTSHRSHRTSATNGLTLQISGKDNSGDVQLHLSGDMDGQIITFAPTGELTIGNARGVEKQYNSSGRSVRSSDRSLGKSSSVKATRSGGRAYGKEVDSSRPSGRLGRGRHAQDDVYGA